MEAENGSYVVLFCVNDFLVVSLAEEGESYAVCAERRLDDVRNISFVCVGIEVVKRLSACLLMAAEVVVGSVCDSPKLAPSEREEVFDVGGSL